ncbi:MAG: HAD family hydrolase [Burkholderiaceae bacterium]|jgi:phosphoglycolate phosphatase-like HAD superfamily hydrolase|nr:HAD family hydrolase [Burkholderiaceae bacterium]
MHRPHHAVLFDFEGTLVDFQWRLSQAEAELRQACAVIGCPTAGSYADLWNAAAHSFEPQGRVDELRRALGPIYDRWDADALTRWAPRPGAVALLERLAASGIRTALVSNVGRLALGAALERFGLARWLAPVISRDDVTMLKPHPQGTLRTLAALGVTAPDALFVGDSRADVLAARAAGMRVAIVRNGECKESDFSALPPDLFVSQLDEIAEWAQRAHC